MKLIDIHCRGSWLTCNKTLITLLVVVWQDLAIKVIVGFSPKLQYDNFCQPSDLGYSVNIIEI